MIGERAVVLADGAPGLRVAGWLARRGVAVRHVGRGANGVDVRWPNAVAGERSVLEPWLGAVIDVSAHRGIHLRGRLHPLTGRRRDLARLGGGGLIGLARDLRPRVGGFDTVGEWATAQLGRAAWSEVLSPLLSKLFSGPVDGLASGLAGLWFAPPEARWWAPDGDNARAAQGATEAILDAGGEALHDVEVSALEIEGDRVSAVVAEFGREAVDDVLFTDLSPAAIAALLPQGTLPDNELAALAVMTATDTAMVTVRADATHLPWEVWLADPESPAIRITRSFGRPGEPRPDRVTVEVLDGGEDEETLRARALTALGPIARARDEGSSVVRVPNAYPRPSADAAAITAMERLRALGVVAVGPAATHLPLGLTHEARLAAGWAASRSTADALAEMLVAPRSARGRVLLP